MGVPLWRADSGCLPPNSTLMVRRGGGACRMHAEGSRYGGLSGCGRPLNSVTPVGDLHVRPTTSRAIEPHIKRCPTQRASRCAPPQKVLHLRVLKYWAGALRGGAFVVDRTHVTHNHYFTSIFMSKYYKNGVNFAGPAPRPLYHFEVSLSDDGKLVVNTEKIVPIDTELVV